MFWAIRGGGGGQYGVVTEFVIRHFPASSRVAMGTLSLAPLSESGADASWDAAAVLFRNLPDLMDAGVAGALTIATGETALKFNPSLNIATSGAVITQVFWSFNKTSDNLSTLTQPIIAKISSNTNTSLSFSTTNFKNYTSFYSAISGSNTAGAGGISTSRLLARSQLNHPQLRTYLQRALKAQNSTQGTYATIGLSGGPGVIHTPNLRWGSLHSAWRSAYLHFYVGGSSPPKSKTTPKEILEASANWLQQNKESLWREWAPEMGSYMNEGNPCSENWKEDFYGRENFERLLAVKRKFDPSESLFVLSGVGSEGWEYDLDSGRLCKEV
ncbi:VAO-type flavoprotein oxidase [Pseudocercospora fuligena]|uniref:VAO-type flavoprotein oxidase n=1 Tax=Pseudocercospora fuligena TaxID=685502 RepID=A0A8H6R580_9PEZI|nr:VAO-type flavoprotein oxidase [Pseudocercospora fuligena]